MKRYSILALAVLLGSPAAFGQRLLWERGQLRSNSTQDGLDGLTLAPNGQQLMATGVTTTTPPPGNSCSSPTFQALYQLWNLNGTLANERLGRRIGPGEQGVIAANGSGYWWTGIELLCRRPRPVQRGYVQRLSWRGDTLRAWPLAPTPPSHSGRVLLLRGDKVLVAGDDQTSGPGQDRQFSLTCSDTATGTVLWRRLYIHPPFTGDHCTGLATLPSGGYLLTGDGYNNTSQPAQLIETDSLGRQRRRVLIQPLGPNYQTVNTNDGFNNVLVLPNHGGYVLSGTADSAVAGVPSAPVHAGYVMRLDTALRLQWAYRHPPASANGLTRSQYAFRVRLLPNGTLAFLLQDAGPFSTATHLVQLSLQGQRLGHYDLLSNGFTNLAPFDWLWVGDGTLLLCGKALAAPGTGGVPFRAYLARWDMRGTPLAAARPVATDRTGTLNVFPNPATDRLEVRVSRPPAGALFQLVAVGSGRLVLTLPLPASGQLTADVSQVPAGIYVGRVLDDGQVRTGCKVVIFR